MNFRGLQSIPRLMESSSNTHTFVLWYEVPGAPAEKGTGDVHGQDQPSDEWWLQRYSRQLYYSFNNIN